MPTDTAPTAARAPSLSEKAVLGAALIEPSCLPEIRSRVEPAQFFHTTHRTIYEAMQRVFDREGGKLDIVLLQDELSSRGELENVGGQSYLIDLQAAVGHAGYAIHYATAVVRDAIDRQILRQVAVVNADPEAKKVDVLRDLVMKREGLDRPAIWTSRDLAYEGLRDLQSANGITGVLTGIGKLDRAFMGLDGADGDILFIGAPTNLGKTALAVKLLINMSLASVRCLFFSTEMRAVGIFLRMIPIISGVPASSMRTRKLEGQWPKITAAAESTAGWDFGVCDHPRPSLADIRAACIAFRPKVIFLDHLHHVAFDLRGAPKDERIEEFIVGLKTFLREQGIVGVVLGQFNREYGKSPNRPPTMSDIKGSSAIEQESSQLMLMWRPPAEELKRIEDEEGIVAPKGMKLIEAMIEKNRKGYAGFPVRLFLDEATVNFMEEPVKAVQQELEVTDGI